MNDTRPSLCLRCNKPLLTPNKFRPTIYCSTTCRVAAHRRKKLLAARNDVGTDTTLGPWFDSLDALVSAVAAGAQEAFGTIYCDPPWRYNNHATRNSAAKQYPTMTVDELAAMPVGKLAGSKSLLWLWTTVAFRLQAEALIKCWGFTFRSELVWNKVNLGMGNHIRLQHETLLLANRGGLRPATRSLRSVIEEKRSRHSAKPERVRHLVEINSPSPRLELFGRKRSVGWTTFGNQDQTRSDAHNAYVTKPAV